MFYVYHKVKGDRISGADYRLLGEYEVRVAAHLHAMEYNKAHGYKTRGMHHADNRVVKVNQM